MNDRAHDDEIPIHLTEVYVAKNPQQAHLLLNVLEQEGIRAAVHNAPLQGAGGELPLGWTTAPRVLVARVDVTRARAVAEQFDESVIRAGAASEVDGTPPAAAEPAWPECPSCAKPRETVCPYCYAAGSDFAMADMNFSMSVIEQRADGSGSCGSCGHGGTDTHTSAELPAPTELPEPDAGDSWQELPALLMCPVCDEPFPPQYYRQCAGCGHDFGEGVELPDPIHHEQLSQRAIGVVAILGGIVVLAAVYLWIIL